MGMAPEDEPDRPLVECPHCGTRHDARRVETTISPDGAMEYWCPLPDCPDHPMDLEDHLVGTWSVSLEES